MECSGTIRDAGSDADFKAGDKVNVSTLSAFKTLLRWKSLNVTKIIGSMSFIEAAASPTAALLDYHAVVNIAQLVIDQYILIHKWSR